MDIRELKVFDKVIIHDNSAWNGEICIVDWCDYGMCGLESVKKLSPQYIVGIWNANNIELFN